MEALRKEVGDINDVLDKQDKSIESLQNVNEGRITRLEQQVYDTHKEILRILQRSMRDNLVFQNIPESHQEIIQTTLLNFMTQDLRIPSSQMSKILILRAHRMGATRGAHPRSIVAKLNEEGLSIIFGHANNLKGKNFRCHASYPNARSNLCQDSRRQNPIKSLPNGWVTNYK